MDSLVDRATRVAPLALCAGGLVLATFPAAAHAQGLLSHEASERVEGVGWAGFLDVAFLTHAALALSLAVALGAAVAYHPRARARVDTVEEAEAPKGYVTYAAVGALIGLMVVQYGLVVGFVVFGIGGLFRFRTTLPSVAGTGRLIFVTLVGLSCGLDLPHLGVLATAFGVALVFVLDGTVTYCVEVKGLDADRLAEASDAYRGLIEASGGRVIHEKRGFSKQQVSFVVRAPARLDREALARTFEAEVPAALRGTVDWEVE